MTPANTYLFPVTVESAIINQVVKDTRLQRGFVGTTSLAYQAHLNQMVLLSSQRQMSPLYNLE